jgi:NADPH-dependent curcumin reductase CurA
MNNQQWTVAARPRGAPVREDFALREQPLARPGEGQMLIQVLYLSVAPVMAMYMSGESIAQRPPLAIGDMLHGRGVGRVLISRHPDYEPGDVVHGQMGWQKYCVTTAPPEDRFYKFQADDLPPHLALGALGMTGFSAYCGFVTVGEPSPGRPVLVSGAAGGVGHLVVQIARILGCEPVVGIAGGPEKCALLAELGCHTSIDYRQGHLAARMREHCPDGFDLYFDNVGGQVLEAALENLAFGARIVLCGSISEYNQAQVSGPANYTRLRRHDASMRGFYVYNHEAGFAAAEATMADWIRRGELRPVQHIVDGFDKLPQALMGLFTGDNTGKQIVRVHDEGEV